MMRKTPTALLFTALTGCCLLYAGALNAASVKDMDVAGISLGMQPDAANKIAEEKFSLHQLKVWMEKEYGQNWHRETQAIPPRKHATQMPDAIGYLHLYFTNPPMEPAILTLWQKLDYPLVVTAAQFDTKPPTVDDVLNALNEKYGPPDVTDEGAKGTKHLVWQDGDVCKAFQKPTELPAMNIDPKRIGNLPAFSDCGPTLYVQVAGSKQIKSDDSLYATTVKFYLFDFPTLYINQSQYNEIVRLYREETLRKLEENQMEANF